MRFHVFLCLWSVTSCLSIRSVKLQRLKFQTQRDILYKKLRLCHALLKRLTCLRHGVGKICITFILAVVLLLPPPCPGDAVCFLVKAKVLCLAFQMSTQIESGFIVFVSSQWDTASQHGKGHNISVTCLRYSANHNAPDSWPIRAHLASQNDELCKNRRVSERRSIAEQQ